MHATDNITSPSRQNLRRLCHLRFAAVAVEGLAAILAKRLFNLALPVHYILGLLALLILVNSLTLWRLRNTWRVSDSILFIHLVFDVAILTVLLYLSGGSTNPFVMLYLVPLALTAASLPQRYTWAMATLTTFCYGFLMFYYVPLSLEQHHHDQVFSLHIVGMWFGFVLSAFLIAWFGVRMAQAVRNRDQQLAQLRESELRQERVVALGALAAGAAHELGTPLATLSILTDDLEPDSTLSSRNLTILREQLARCKQILNSLAASAGAVRAQGGGKLAVDEFIKTIVAKWQRSRPQARLIKGEYQGSDPVPSVITEQTLTQAIINILNNAADASPDHVELECHWTTTEIQLEIADRGAGLSPELAQQAGEAFVTTKSAGLGLGLFLSFATLERLGGEIHLFNREGGGAVCRLRLPLQNLMVS